MFYIYTYYVEYIQATASSFSIQIVLNIWLYFMFSGYAHYLPREAGWIIVRTTYFVWSSVLLPRRVPELACQTFVICHMCQIYVKLWLRVSRNFCNGNWIKYSSSFEMESQTKLYNFQFNYWILSSIYFNPMKNYKR